MKYRIKVYDQSGAYYWGGVQPNGGGFWGGVDSAKVVKGTRTKMAQEIIRARESWGRLCCLPGDVLGDGAHTSVPEWERAEA